MAALLAIGLLVLWPMAAACHGGPPKTQDVLLGSGHISLVTSHGFFAEDSSWAWICEEATGADLAANVVRTPSRWLVGTLYGLKTSHDGCEWSDDPALTGSYVLRVLQDSADPERVWAATNEGVWVLDGDEDATLQQPIDFSVRHMGQGQDGTLLLVGFDGPLPVAQLGEQRIPLPAETGRIEVLGADEAGRFYVRFPAGATDRLIRVSEDGAVLLLPLTDLIRDVAVIGSDLYVLYRDGVAWSEDDGLTWSSRRGEPISCLRSSPDGFYACPASVDARALLQAPTLPADPALWAWQTVLNFHEITGNICASGSTAGRVCPIFWPTVSEELGVSSIDTDTEPSSGDEPSTEAEPQTGCSTAAAPGAPSWLVWMAAGLFLRGLFRLLR